jgi:hypothetical protein
VRGQRLALRATLAFIALPGLVAFGVPLLWLLPIGGQFLPLQFGAPLLLLGCVVLGWCVRDFFNNGRGTLAP